MTDPWDRVCDDPCVIIVWLERHLADDIRIIPSVYMLSQCI